MLNRNVCTYAASMHNFAVSAYISGKKSTFYIQSCTISFNKTEINKGSIVYKKCYVDLLIVGAWFYSNDRTISLTTHGMQLILARAVLNGKC